MSKPKHKKVDKALDMTFPASDPPAVGGVTGTEPPARPASRKAPLIHKHQVEQAAGKGGGTPSGARARDERSRRGR